MDPVRRPGQLSPARALGGAFGRWLVVVAIVVLPHGAAFGGDKDADALAVMAQAMDDFMGGKFAIGLGRLDETLRMCAGSRCEPSVRAQLLVARGILVGGGRKDLTEARRSFEKALREDAAVEIDPQWMTKPLEKAFAEAQKAVAKSSAPQAKKRVLSREQTAAVSTAQGQLNQKDWSGCMQTLIAVMASDEFAAGKLALAKCEEAGGLLLEATADALSASKLAEAEGSPDALASAKALGDKLTTDTPTIAIAIPSGWSEVEAKIDGVPIASEQLKKPIVHNPGKATVEVLAKRGRFPVTFKSTEVVDRGEQVTVNVEAAGAGGNDSVVIQCIMSAKTPSDVNRCIETGGKGRGFTFRSGLEFATYDDSFHTNVSSPALFVSGENPTAGWQVGGSFLVDVVSTASPDIIASATRRYDEVRYAGTLSGDYKIGPAKVGVDGGLSVEPDYVARSIGTQIGADLMGKTLSPLLRYTLSKDTLGRSGTPFDVFSRDLTRHSIDAGLSVVVNAATVAVAGATLELDEGDSSKPYRHVPMFGSDVAARIPLGATASLVNAVRLDLAPLERLPDSRRRGAILGRIAHRFERTTIRADQRFYNDNWGQKASTTDARIYVDMSDAWRLGMHGRFNAQGPVSFWKRAYVAEPSAQGYRIPDYRTVDRELGPLIGVTFGVGARWAFATSMAVGLEVEGVYTEFLDHIYDRDRFGLFTASTFELEID